MKSDRDHILRAFVAILLLIGLANISSCKWGNWDLMGGEPINQDDSNGDGGNNGDGGISNFPPVVFTAARSGTKLNEPIELFSSFEDGSEIIALTGILNRAGRGDEFKVSPDGAETAKLSGLIASAGDVLFFEWVP